MMWALLAGGLVFVAIAGGMLIWWVRRPRDIRLISFVGLLREPLPLEPLVVAKIAGKAWNADLGDGDSEGADGFVVGAGELTTIMLDGRMFLVNSFPVTYVEHPEEMAEEIVDLPIHDLFLQHRAWFSCDAMGVDDLTSEQEVQDSYRRLGRLFAELLDDNCLLILLPDAELAYPVNGDSAMALRSNDPIGTLEQTRRAPLPVNGDSAMALRPNDPIGTPEQTLRAPLVEISERDVALNVAVAKARQRWPEFVASFERGIGQNFAIKAPISHGDKTEFIWIAVTSIEGDRIYGELANEPMDLGAYKLGSRVSVPLDELNDWCYVDAAGNLVGGFTIEVLQRASQRDRNDHK